MNKKFDIEGAKAHLSRKAQDQIEHDEKSRIELLDKVTHVLKNLFKTDDVEIYLVGSITTPFKFHSKSDIDIVLKNFKGDRFDVWTKLENELERNVEIILFESCAFKDHIINHGLKVM